MLFGAWGLDWGSVCVCICYMYALVRSPGMAFATQQQTKKEGSGLVLTGTPTRSPSVNLILAKRE